MFGKESCYLPSTKLCTNDPSVSLSGPVTDTSKLVSDFASNREY